MDNNTRPTQTLSLTNRNQFSVLDNPEPIQEQRLLVKVGSPMFQNESSGFVKPLKTIDSDGRYHDIRSELYPKDIFVTKAFDELQKKGSNTGYVILRRHFYSVERSRTDGAHRWRADAAYADRIPLNNLIPIIQAKLPSVADPAICASIFIPFCSDSAKLFMIQDGTELYGPFEERDCIDGSRLIKAASSPALNLSQHHVLQWTSIEQASDFIVELSGNRYVSSIKDLTRMVGWKSVDFIPDAELIKVAANARFGIVEEMGLSKPQLNELKNTIKRYIQNNKSLANDDGVRLSRLESLLGSYLSSTDTGSAIVKKYIESNPSVLRHHGLTTVDAKSASFEENKEEHQRLKENIEDLQQEREALSQEVEKIKRKNQTEIEELKRSHKEKLEQIDANQDEQIKQTLEHLDTEIEKKTKRLDELRETIDTTVEFDKWQGAAQLYKEQATIAKEELATIEAEKEAAIKSLKNSVENTLTNVTDFVVAKNFLNGNSAAYQKSEKVITVRRSDNQPKDLETLISHICSVSQKQGRPHSYEEVVNLLICTTQSLLVVFAGRAGSGKTSTAKQLADGLGLLANNNDDLFLSVPVARGWSSSRDLLGFYNPVSKQYQAAKTGLFDFIRSHQSAKSNAKKIVLLDEANLSSIEHYFSDFLLLCDAENINTEIKTGCDEHALHIDSNYSFIATINLDFTTEPLSPRLINRAPVVSMDNDAVGLNHELQEMSLSGYIDCAVFDELKAPRQEQCKEKLKAVISLVKKTLKENDGEYSTPVCISPRKLKAIYDYLHVATNFMNENAALDFAIAQYILPEIAGHGPAFGARLERLQDVIHDYKISSAQLLRIIRSGSDMMQNYSYFS